MGGFEDLLLQAGFERDESALGAILESERPSEGEIDALYDAVAEEAAVDSDSLLLEFAPSDVGAQSRSHLDVTVWYESYLSGAERNRVVSALRRRLGL